VKKIKQWLQEVGSQKHVHSDDLDRIIQRCKRKYDYLFPDYECTKKGSKCVHHFNVPGVAPISLEKVHGDREYVPPKYARYILDGLDDLVDYIEIHSRGEIDDHDSDSGNLGSEGHEQPSEE
jgi:hypothetical protein